MNLAPVIPLQLDDQNGYSMITDIEKLVAFHLKNLLLTSKGEKISDPSYGVGLKRYLFEPMTRGTFGLIRDEISDQISSYLSYVNVLGIGVMEEGENSISIKLKYSLPNSNISEVLIVSVDGSSSNPSGGNAFY